MGKHDPVITYYQAARMLAQAWYEDSSTTPAGKAGSFRDSLDKDPAGALTVARRDSFGIHPRAKMIALGLYSDALGDIDFDDYDQATLQSIFTTGLDNNGIQVTMQPSLWVTPSGKITEIGPNPTGISLSDFARIYAYIFFRTNLMETPRSRAILKRTQLML
jgi:hypothetical protein